MTGALAPVARSAREAGSARRLLAARLPLFLVLALTDGLGEELGWRGSALPRLLRRRGPVVASLLFVGLQVAVAAVLVVTGGLRLPPSDGGAGSPPD